MADLSVYVAVGRGASPIMYPLLPGQISFRASRDHTSAMFYTARIWTYGHNPGDAPAATQNLGVPTPIAGTIDFLVADLSVTFATLPAGNYTLSIQVTTLTGTSESEESDAFSLPLS